MLRFWPTKRLWIAVAVVLWPGLLWCSAGRRSVESIPIGLRLQDLEQQVWRTPVHDSEFADVPHYSVVAQCERTRAPEELTTPDPLLGSVPPDWRIRVSFIVGTDGKVHSPLVLESMGQSEDRTVLNTVRRWRYRPGMCNGVPTETEGKVDFSSR